MREHEYTLRVRLTRLAGVKEDHEPSVVFILKSHEKKPVVASGSSIGEAYRNMRMLQRSKAERRNNES